MKRKTLMIASYILCLLSMLFPWFTYNPKVMGYCWGFQFYFIWAVPMVVIGIYVFFKQNLLTFMLSELSLVAVLGSYIIAFSRWQEICNIIAGFQWEDGFHTATIGYWISLGLFWLLVVLLQIERLKRKS